MADDRGAEIHSLLLPLAEGRLIIPRACVAEVIAFQDPTPLTGGPPWYLGAVPWSNRAVPLISFEGACGGAVAPPSARTRIVVLHSLGSRLSHFALLAQGFPQLVRVTPASVRAESSRLAENLPVLCQIRIGKESPVIPDLLRLEAMIAQEIRVARRA